MPYNIETPKKLRTQDIEAAAELTALGFGRNADDHNLRDTTDHLNAADHIQLVRDEERLVGFAAYRRLLWRSSC
ncbi:MAG TPA: hypothetical protein VIQ80_00825 [Candidatus Saccharimonadales bacterium]